VVSSIFNVVLRLWYLYQMLQFVVLSLVIDFLDVVYLQVRFEIQFDLVLSFISSSISFSFPCCDTTM